MKAEAKKIAATKDRAAKKAAPKPKPSKIMVLKLGSTVLQSLGSHEMVEINRGYTRRGSGLYD
jgi:hypothetical protein